MRKGTIFQYEFKRLFFSKEYLLLLVTALAYSFSLLRSMVLFGTNYTAPFSQWTFCAYISSVLPILLILLLALCARQFTASERGAMAIIDATPMPSSVFKGIRYGAIACAFLIVAALSFIICFAFYWFVFDYKAIGGLICSGTMLTLPSSLLIFGAAMLLGKKKAVWVYVLLAVVLVIGVFGISLPEYMDIFGSSVTNPLFSGIRSFRFSPAFLTSRIVFAAMGITGVVLSLRQAYREKVSR